MNDNIEFDPELDLNLPRLATNEILQYQFDSWSECNTSLLLLEDHQIDSRREIKSEPSSHSSAEYNDIPNNMLPQTFHVIPPSTNTSMPTVPSNTDFAGDYNFNVKVACNEVGTQKPQVTYSKLLNKAYINMGHSLPIDFYWQPMITGLIVRGTMLYSIPHEAPNLVKRCNNHKTLKANDGTLDPSSDHVLLCRSLGAQYYGSLESNKHLNVTVPLGLAQTGDNSVRVLYEFACKNSCISGMNRRSVECVFTLESMNGQILGRRKIGIRICSCPKRDMAKEEQHEQQPLGKRKLKQCPENMHPEHMPKRSKDTTPLDTTYYNLPPIMGKKNYATFVQLAFGVLAGTMIRSSPEDQEKLQPCVAAYEKLANELEKKTDA